MPCQVQKQLGGGTAGAADFNWTKGYLMPCDVMLSIHCGGTWLEEPLLGDGLSISFQVVRNCIVHHWVCVFFYPCYYYCFLFLCCPVFFSIQESYIFSIPPLIPQGRGGGGEWVAAWCLVTNWGLNHDTQLVRYGLGKWMMRWVGNWLDCWFKGLFSVSESSMGSLWLVMPLRDWCWCQYCLMSVLTTWAQDRMWKILI